MADANFVKTIYHGLPENLIPFNPTGGDYLAFLGRFSPEKRPDRAIEIAIRSGLKIKMAAKIDDADRDYYEREIAPLMDHPLVEYVGEIGDGQKTEFLGNARALLFPIDWPEPFGLVMIESMAAGTPVVAWKNGSTQEVMDHGRSGFLVESIDQAVDAVAKCADHPRELVRGCFQRRFTSLHMAQAYVKLFDAAIRAEHGVGRAPFLIRA